MSKLTRLAVKIDRLKTLLVDAEDFAKIMDYFFEELALDDAFRDAGEVVFSRFSVYDPVGEGKSLHVDRSGRLH